LLWVFGRLRAVRHSYPHLHGELDGQREGGITFQDGLALARGDLAEHDRVLHQLDSSGKQVYFFSRESFHLSMLDQIRADPRGYAGVLYLNVQSLLKSFFSVLDFVPAFLPLLGLGLFGLAWSRRRFYGELILVAAMLPPLTFLLFFIFARYLSPMLLPMAGVDWFGPGTLGRLVAGDRNGTATSLGAPVALGQQLSPGSDRGYSLARYASLDSDRGDLYTSCATGTSHGWGVARESCPT